MDKNRYQKIADELATAIRSGELAPGTKLPPLRSIMRKHGVALATAVRAYNTLEAAGMIVGELGRGTFVRDTAVPGNDVLVQRSWPSVMIDLGFSYPSLPGQDELLRDGLRALASTGDLGSLLQAPPQGGRWHYRESAARHLRNRAIRVPASQVLIVNGAQHGLSVTLSALLKPGDVLAVDALTYPGLKALAKLHRLELSPLPIIDGTPDLDALHVLCTQRRVKAVYCMPTIHNPLGSVMPLATRKRLANLAEQHDLLIIEDGAYAFLAETGPEPVQRHAPDRTVYVSGLSKSFAAGLRVGFVVAPPSCILALEQAIRVSIWNTPSLNVALSCQWIESGVIDSLESAKRKDAKQRQLLARKVLQNGKIRAHPSSYFLWLELPDETRAEEIARHLQEERILVATAEPFSTTSHAPQAIRLALGTLPLTELSDALTKVDEAVSR
jgi:DNA-binding transcriptional MocR family regulator